MINRIIYLDAEVLNSCSSQICGGIEAKSITSCNSAHAKNGTVEYQTKGEVGAEVGLLKSKASGKGSLSARTKGDLEMSNNRGFSKEILPFDNVHNALLENLSKEGMIKSDFSCAKIGDLVNYSSEITIINKEMLSDLAKNKDVFEKLVALSNTSKDQQSQMSQNSSFDELVSVLKLLDYLIPYDVFAKIGDSIVVLKSHCFRTGPTISPHMFGGKATVFGYVTNEIRGTCTSENNAFAYLIRSMNAALCAILNCSQMKVICPISIYYK